jgi:hypothetical protein
MCALRIKSRLRFEKPSGRSSLKKLLEDTIKMMRQSLKSDSIPIEDREATSSFLTSSKTLRPLVDAYDGHRAIEKLECLINGLHTFTRTCNLPLIGDIRYPGLDPSKKAGLLRMIKKVARYREAATFFCRVQRRYRFFNDVTVTIVNLRESDFTPRLRAGHTPILRSVLGCVNAELTVAELCNRLEVSEKYASKKYREQVETTLLEGKVHAEIQLVYYYEIHPSDKPPRVISSNKSACFLCNLFMQAHGKYHTPRSHGRLYPAWRLPSLTAEDRFERATSLRLGSILRERLATAKAKNWKPIRYAEPSESDLVTLPPSTTSPSVVEVTETIQVDGPLQTDLPANTEELAVALGESNDPINPVDPSTTPVDVEEDKNGANVNAITLPWRKLHAGQGSKLHKRDKLNIQIVYSSSAGDENEGSKKHLRYVISHLSKEEAELVRKQKENDIIHAASLDPEIEYTPKDKRSILLSHNDTMVRITLE